MTLNSILQSVLNGHLLLFQHANPEIPVAAMDPQEALDLVQGLGGNTVPRDLSLLAEPMAKVLERFRVAEPIRRDPTDEGAWLVYADWLTEQGDPRGELIFIERRLRWNETKDESEKAAILDRKKKIEDELTLSSTIEVRRSVFCSWVNGYWSGDWVCCEGDIFLERIFESEDARFLRHLTLRVDDLGKIRQAPCLSSLWELDLSGMAIGPDGARILAETPWLRSLRVLVLDGTDLAIEGMRVDLEAWAHGRGLRLKI